MNDLNRLRKSISNDLNSGQANANAHPELNSGRYKNGRKVGSTRREKRRLGKQFKKARRIAHATKQPLSDLYVKIKRTRGKKKVNFQELTSGKESQQENRPRKNEAADDQVPKSAKKSSLKKASLNSEENFDDSEELEDDNDFDDDSDPETTKMKKSSHNSDTVSKIKRKQIERLAEEDELEIKKYAKKLKLNKRKNKTLPKSFEEDGLAYLLEICDSNKRAAIAELSDDEETEEKFEEEIGSATSDLKTVDENVKDTDMPDEMPILTKKRANRQKRNNFNEIENEQPKNSVLLKGDEFFDDTTTATTNRKKVKFADILAANDEEKVLTDDDEEEEQKELKEDIYGRLRDKRGNIVKIVTEENSSSCDNNLNSSGGQKSSSTIKDNLLSHEKLDGKTSELLTKNFRSLVNRLSEANVVTSSGKIAEFYAKYSRTVVKACLTESYFNSLLRPEKVPNRLILEHCLLLAVVHTKISTEITAYFVEELCLKLQIFEKDLNSDEISQMDKSTDNVCLVLSYLCLLKVVQPKLIFDVLKLLAGKLNEKSVELILTILQSGGSTLRKENPLELKTFIEDVGLKSNSIKDENLINRSRLQFMLDTLQMIKNNNFLKVANCDLELNEHFVKLLRSSFPGKQLEAPLPMTLQDLWSAKVKGRWWIIGSAVLISKLNNNNNSSDQACSIENDQDSTNNGQQQQKSNFSDHLIKLAKKNHMNTELRRNIFCIIVSSEDYLDAFEKLCRLSLKGQQEREIIHIALTCCSTEKNYNPFYAYLLQRFCKDQPRFLLTTQFAFWDKIKQLQTLKETSLRNLACCLAHLIANKVLPLTVLKVIDFSAMDKRTRKFAAILFEKFLTTVNNDETLKSIFANCLANTTSKKRAAGGAENSSNLVDDLRTFLRQKFLADEDEKIFSATKSTTATTKKENSIVLKNKVETLDKFLYYHMGSSLL